MSAIIEMSDVSFAYGHQEGYALRDVSLSIEEGSFVGVIGPSGAGKSTLAAALSGAIPHHHAGRLYGETRIAGIDTCEAGITDIAQTVGCVLQDIDAQMVASVVEDELLFGLENFGVPRERIEGRLSAALDAVGIADLRHREIATLSGGQKQKVAIAAILALAPRVLVLDEPTAALDPASSRSVFDVLRKAQRATGVTVVVVEQMVALLAEYCDRVIVLDEGEVAIDGSPHEVFARSAELRAIGVDTPRTVRISNSLAASGLAVPDGPTLTVDEAESLVLRILDGAGAPGRGAVRTEGRIAPKGAGPEAHPIPYAGMGATARAGGPSATHDDPVVEMRGASFSYGPGAASVEGLDLVVRPGEILGVVGQNGAGKTTLTKLLNGLLKPTSGTVRIAGLDTGATPVSRIAAHAATLFQNPDRQLCRGTVLDEVAFGLELHGEDPAAARDRSREVIERFGLPASAEPFALSRGQRQMVALASVVATEPELIILDEPTSGLDYRECMTVMETVRERARAGAAVVMVCHDMEVVSDFATSLAVMACGRIIAQGPTRRIFALPDVLRRASVEPPQVVELSDRLAATHPRFTGITEVADLVERVKELRTHA